MLDYTLFSAWEGILMFGLQQSCVLATMTREVDLGSKTLCVKVVYSTSSHEGGNLGSRLS